MSRCVLQLLSRSVPSFAYRVVSGPYPRGRVSGLITFCRTRQVRVDLTSREPYYSDQCSLGYLETCAAIGLVLFAHQMLLNSPYNNDYADVLELALHNAVLVGVSLDGKRFFYDNPLATIGKHSERSAWFEVSCCPANVRLVTSIKISSFLTIAWPGCTPIRLLGEVHLHGWAG